MAGYRDLYIAILAGLGGMLGWGFAEFATKKSVDRIGPVSSLVWAHLLGTVMLAGVVLWRSSTGVPQGWLKEWHEWMSVAFFGALQAAVYYFAYRGFEKGEVSVLSPIFASFAGLVAVFSVLVFGEVLHLKAVASLGLIFGGVISINIDTEALRSKRLRMKGVKGVKEILIATFLATIWTLGWNRFTKDKDWILYTACMFFFMTVSALLIAFLTRTNLFGFKAGSWKFLMMIAAGEVVAYLAITLGYSTTIHTSIVAILSGASSLPTIVLARMFLGERLSIHQAVSSLVIISGIIFLAVL